MSSGAKSVVIVFARAPVAGAVKTRLVPRLGAEGAARLQRRLIRNAVRTARSVGAIELHATRKHAWLRSLGVPMRVQRGADLGSRMFHALRRRPGAILIGCDVPELQARDLARAARLLRGTDVVLAPAEDGGYALIALRRVSTEIFRNIRWGSASVYDETVKRLRRYRWRALRTVWDVDRPDDLARLGQRRLFLTPAAR